MKNVFRGIASKFVKGKSRFVIAYWWNMAGKLMERGISIFSTLVLVRFLSPEDFGIVAISMMFYGFFQVATSMSIDRYLIMHPNPSEELYNSAWTLNILLRIFAVSLLFLSSSLIADYMGNPKLVFILQLTALTGLVASFKSFGLVKFAKEVNFGPLNRITVVAKIFSTFITLCIAIQSKSYFALLAGNFVMELMLVILSHKVSQHKSYFCLKLEKGMFSFSLTMMIRSLLAYSRSQLDTFLIAKIFGQEKVGAFNVTKTFALLPQTELITPGVQPIFSLLAENHSDAELIKKGTFRALFICYLIIFPCIFGFFAVSTPFVTVVLGDKWQESAQILGWISILMLPFATQPLLNAAYDLLKKEKVSLYIDIISIISFVSALLILIPSSLLSFIQLRAFVGIGILFLSLLLATVFLRMHIKHFLMVMSAPLCCSILMYYALQGSLFQIENNFLNLFTNVIAGATIYAIAMSITVFIIYIYNSGSWFIQILPAEISNTLQKFHQKVSSLVL